MAKKVRQSGWALFFDVLPWVLVPLMVFIALQYMITSLFQSRIPGPLDTKTKAKAFVESKALKGEPLTLVETGLLWLESLNPFRNAPNPIK